VTQLKKFIAAPVAIPRVDWMAMLERFAVGDKQLFKDYTQAGVASRVAHRNRKGDKRFVTKGTEQGVYVIRVK
jgi:hypothetical protein